MPHYLSLPVDGRSYLAGLWHEGARRLGVTPLEAPAGSGSARSIGGRVRHGDGAEAWLRVAPFDPASMDREWWTGTRQAAELTGVNKPQLLADTQWTQAEPVPVEVSAELLELVTDRVVAPGTQYLAGDVELDDSWFSALYASLKALATHRTERSTHWHSPKRYEWTLHAWFGDLAAGIAPEFGTEHLDLHWGNVTAPTLSILDWEHWGSGVAGYGAARLYLTALGAPDTAKTLYSWFADALDSPSGRYAQLVAAADVLGALATYPDEADLAPVVRAVARDLLG